LHIEKVNDLILNILLLILFYDRLTPLSCQFALSVPCVSILKFYQKALMYSEWKQAIDDEMDALISSQTWNLVPIFCGLSIVS